MMVQLVRAMIEPVFTRPFGEVDLTDMLMTGDFAARLDDSAARPTITFELWRSERRRRRQMLESGAIKTSFNRGMFLLGKQLIYIDRYGKLFLSDIPLMWDRSAFERLLAEPMVQAEQPVSRIIPRP